jgi:hypothetical protein
MIMVESSKVNIINLKFLLFKEMSGLRSNFDKSEMVILGYYVENQPIAAI